MAKISSLGTLEVTSIHHMEDGENESGCLRAHDEIEYTRQMYELHIRRNL